MTTSDFANRHGYQMAHEPFGSRSHLPLNVREAGVQLMLRYLTYDGINPIAGQKGFVQAVRNALPMSPNLWKWYSRERDRTDEAHFETVSLREPLLHCDYELYYVVVENVYKELEYLWWDPGSLEVAPYLYLTDDFNLLLRSHGVPWALQKGWVIPLDEAEFVDELNYVKQDGSLVNSDAASNPKVSLVKAFDAIYSKQATGMDIAGACSHAWNAWETARKLAGGMDAVRSNYPELWSAITEWQKLIHAGRHPGKEIGPPPSEEQTKFIVRLLTNAVRLVNPDSDAA